MNAGKGRRSGGAGGGCGTIPGSRAITHSSPLSTYSAPGALRQGPRRAAEFPAVARTCGNGVATCVCCCRSTG
ncbi:hypothetical protein EEJ42_08385 [Streptomyces botrytidirepellens]|uniref:Uncharacterized protein n=1 Tax=Streptomyces botrytidirepellens TaxID=2486417 RepID=A0A3M8WRL6_9ACTN|nr:hypothetical protein EEJ42_08385 [Streptomyces botrytidirepellens]